jgi:3'-phosphoadenosine 5'-phosphosulfate sulfotransferase (PAPS reductase)/FAD synthetase
MKDPYFIEGPAVISFSGGRTSAYMLRKILDAHGGELPNDVFAVFADTGKERLETLDFIRECGERWGVSIHWVERPGKFEKLIEDRGYPPNGVFRFCTGDLKIKPIRLFMRDRGFDFWTMVIGIRSDEPARVVKMRGKVDDCWDYGLPLASADVTESDVMNFWARQPFDLQLRQDEGNCDLCFLKGKKKLIRLIMDRPDLADWWIEQETKVESTFNKAISYRQLATIAENMNRQTDLGFDVDVRHVSKGGRLPVKKKNTEDQLSILFPDDDARPCACTD